jgi:hypothetical protein
MHAYIKYDFLTIFLLKTYLDFIEILHVKNGKSQSLNRRYSFTLLICLISNLKFFSAFFKKASAATRPLIYVYNEASKACADEVQRVLKPKNLERKRRVQRAK